MKSVLTARVNNTIANSTLVVNQSANIERMDIIYIYIILLTRKLRPGGVDQSRDNPRRLLS